MQRGDHMLPAHVDSDYFHKEYRKTSDISQLQRKNTRLNNTLKKDAENKVEPPPPSSELGNIATFTIYTEVTKNE
jgi:hypothetical protein